MLYSIQDVDYVALLLLFGELLGLAAHIGDIADHVEGGLGKVVALTIENRLE